MRAPEESFGFVCLGNAHCVGAGGAGLVAWRGVVAGGAVVVASNSKSVCPTVVAVVMAGVLSAAISLVALVLGLTWLGSNFLEKD